MPDVTIIKALPGLTSLAKKLAENAGVDDPFNSLMKQWFGTWEGMMVSIFTPPIVLGVMTTVGWCIIPCMRGLIQKLIKIPLMKQTPTLGSPS
jgi:hypothetical protein